MTRPIIELDERQSVVVFAPAMVVETVAKFSMDVYRGFFDDDFFHSSEMRKWIGRANNERGHAFNSSVAKRLSELGWQTRENLKVGAITGLSYATDLGDIDVFAWHPSDSRVLIAECKDLFADKTLGEMARRLAKYRGGLDNKGRPDNLEKHTRRIAALRSAPDAIAKFIGKSALELQPVLIFSQPTTVQFHENPELDGFLVMTKDDLVTL